MKPTAKQKYFRLLSFMLILTTYLPVLTKHLPAIIRSHHVWTPVWLISLILLFPSAFKNKFFTYILVYQVIFALLLGINFWEGIDGWTTKAIAYDIYYFTVGISLLMYYRNSGDYKGLAMLIKWTMIFIGITAIMSIYSSFADPLYARKVTGGEIEGLENILKYGGGTYGFAMALVCLFPIMIYYYRNPSGSIFSRNQILLFGVVSLIALIRIQIFADIIIAIYLIIFSFSARKTNTRSILISLSLVIIFLAIPRDLYAELLFNTSRYFNTDSDIYLKLNDMSTYLLTNTHTTETAIGGRAERYPELLGAFVQNPFMGYFSKHQSQKIGGGGHLYFMYRLAVFGILNFIPFIFIFIMHIKMNIRIFSQRYSFYFLLSALSVIVLGLIKNLTGRELWYTYFFIIPGLYYLPVLKKRKVTYTPKNDTSTNPNQ